MSLPARQPAPAEAPSEGPVRPDPSRWRPPPRIGTPWIRRAIVAGAVVYGVAALGTLDVDWERAREGIGRGLDLLAQFARPDFTSRWTDIRTGLLESLAMTLVATAAGIAASIPLGLGAARNLAPIPIYLACRSILALARAFHEVIVAILMVVMLGFGPLAGVVTLIIGTIGFLGKLLAEEIEGIDMKQVEAARSTGAGWLSTLEYAVRPQVTPRFIGLSVYRLDINFRESAIIGIVGAGGIGATLNTAFDRYEFGSVTAILLIIIGIVLMVEYTSGRIRKAVA